jgi:uncharacterized protein YutE (UPF0331/DUF86 family)
MLEAASVSAENQVADLRQQFTEEGAPRFDRTILVGMVASLTEDITKLRHKRTSEVAVLLSDSSLQDGVGVILYHCVRDTLKIAARMALNEGWGPAAQSDGFDLLAKHGLIDAQLAAALAIAVPLEKLLAHSTRIQVAHGYNGVDMVRIWSELPAQLAMLEAFAVAVTAWLQAHGTTVLGSS